MGWGNLIMLQKFINFTKLIVNTTEFMEKFRKSKRDFIRNRKVSFAMNILLIILFDRGYPSAELMQYIGQTVFKYIMSCSTSFVSGISKKEYKNDSIIKHKLKKWTRSNFPNS